MSESNFQGEVEDKPRRRDCEAHYGLTKETIGRPVDCESALLSRYELHLDKSAKHRSLGRIEEVRDGVACDRYYFGAYEGWS